MSPIDRIALLDAHAGKVGEYLADECPGLDASVYEEARNVAWNEMSSLLARASPDTAQARALARENVRVLLDADQGAIDELPAELCAQRSCAPSLAAPSLLPHPDRCARCDGELVDVGLERLVECLGCQRRWTPLVNTHYRTKET